MLSLVLYSLILTNPADAGRRKSRTDADLVELHALEMQDRGAYYSDSSDNFRSGGMTVPRGCENGDSMWVVEISQDRSDYQRLGDEQYGGIAFGPMTFLHATTNWGDEIVWRYVGTTWNKPTNSAKYMCLPRGTHIVDMRIETYMGIGAGDEWYNFITWETITVDQADVLDTTNHHGSIDVTHQYTVDPVIWAKTWFDVDMNAIDQHPSIDITIRFQRTNAPYQLDDERRRGLPVYPSDNILQGNVPYQR